MWSKMQGQLQETMFKIIEGDSQPFYLFIYLFCHEPNLVHELQTFLLKKFVT
jgi:hypothetical protein